MIIAIISEEKVNEIKNTEYQSGMLYNPVQLEDSRWFISLIEAQYLTVEDIIDIIDYVPLQIEE